MTAKRFTLGVCERGLGLTDNETKEQYLEVDDTTLIRLCEVLNELSEENKRLKGEIQGFIVGIQETAKISADGIMKTYRGDYE